MREGAWKLPGLAWLFPHTDPGVYRGLTPTRPRPLPVCCCSRSGASVLGRNWGYAGDRETAPDHDWWGRGGHAEQLQGRMLWGFKPSPSRVPLAISQELNPRDWP